MVFVVCICNAVVTVLVHVRVVPFTVMVFVLPVGTLVIVNVAVVICWPTTVNVDSRKSQKANKAMVFIIAIERKYYQFHQAIAQTKSWRKLRS